VVKKPVAQNRQLQPRKILSVDTGLRALLRQNSRPDKKINEMMAENKRPPVRRAASFYDAAALKNAAGSGKGPKLPAIDESTDGKDSNHSKLKITEG